LLITSALATLFVMSAFVAFNGFPGQDVRDPIAPILVHESQTTVPPVPTEPTRGAALDARTSGGSASHARSRSGRLHGGPSARTVPVSGPRNSAPVQAPSGGQGQVPTPQAGGGLTSTAGGATQPITGATPSVPAPQLPSVSLPEVQVPALPQDPLPVDTSGVTNDVNNLLGG
jgi:hypothetical protein